MSPYWGGLYRALAGWLTPGNRASLYFHSPCFDGVASAVLALDFLKSHERWSRIKLCPVNYDRKALWTRQPLGARVAVVDFLFHPQAAFWVDHHSTTFGDESQYSDAVGPGSPFRVFDPSAPSCASLLQCALEQRYAYRNDRYDPLVYWATKIDSARYDSVDEAIFGDAAALRINLAFQVADRDYPAELVDRLRAASLDDVARMSSTNAKFLHARTLLDEGMERVRRSVSLGSEGIATFRIAGDGVVLNRYAPYYFFPEAMYSVGMVRKSTRTTMTAMRNPWKEFETLHLGKLFEKHGGGGHSRVGSVSVEGTDNESRVSDIMNSIVRSLAEFLVSREQTAAAHA